MTHTIHNILKLKILVPSSTKTPPVNNNVAQPKPPPKKSVSMREDNMMPDVARDV